MILRLPSSALSVPVLTRSNTPPSPLKEPKRSNTLLLASPGGSRELEEASRELQEGPRGLATGFKRLQALSRCFQERSKSHFGFLQELPGPEKSTESFVLCATFAILQFSARVAFGLRFGILLGSILGAVWHPKSVETGLGCALGPAKRRFNIVLFLRSTLFFRLRRASGSAPRGFQDRSKRPPKSLQYRLQRALKWTFIAFFMHNTVIDLIGYA